MRLLVGAVVAIVLLVAAPVAQASQRYAAPTGSGETCSTAAPCALAEAIKKAEAGDEVIIAAGTYTQGPTLTPNSPKVFVHGDFSGPMPTITGTVSGAVPIGVPAVGGRLSYLEIINRSEPNAVAAACNPGGTLDRARLVAETNPTAKGLTFITAR